MCVNAQILTALSQKLGTFSPACSRLHPAGIQPGSRVRVPYAGTGLQLLGRLGFVPGPCPRERTGKVCCLLPNSHLTMLQKQMTFYSRSHKNILGLLQLEHKVQEREHTYCASLTTCPTGPKAQGCVCACVREVGDCIWKRSA